jgi:hypothetical protein
MVVKTKLNIVSSHEESKTVDLNIVESRVVVIGINNPPVLKTDTQEAENLDKAIFS